MNSARSVSGASAGSVLTEFVERRGLESPDGRALYRYECRAEELDTLAACLLDSRSPIEQRIRLVPLVAAENFRRNYREGPWAWTDCGKQVATLRRQAGPKFGSLLLRAFSFWGLKIVRGDGMSHQYLVTLVVNGGFPVAFLEGQSALRALLKRLIAAYVRGGDSLTEQRAGLEIPISRLPQSYRQSQDFERLCIEMAAAVALLARNFDPLKQGLSSYLEGIPGWQSQLPFRLDSDAAKQLLTELLQTARATSLSSLDNAVCVRELRCQDGEWRLAARLSPLPDSLELSGDESLAVQKLALTADGAAFRPIASLSRQPNGRYLIRPRPSASQLEIPAPFDSPDTFLGLAAATPYGLRILPVRDGDALDATTPWTFAAHDDAWHLLAQGDVRTRDRSKRACLCARVGVSGGRRRRIRKVAVFERNSTSCAGQGSHCGAVRKRYL